MAANMIVLSVFLLTFSSTSTSEENEAKINLALYYESLCPDCRDFIVDQLYPTYEKVSSMFNLELIPYGNAKETKHGDQWSFHCQHGKMQCQGNIIETCAIHLNKNKSESTIEFIHCFEKNIVDGKSVENPLSVAEQCAEDLDIDYQAIEDCQKDKLGNALEHQMALKTNALRPKHEYVPWIVLNGKHSERVQDRAEGNLLKLLCETYTGPKPSACQDVHEGRCYNNDKKKHQFETVK